MRKSNHSSNRVLTIKPPLSYGDAARLLKTAHLSELCDLTFGDTEYSWWSRPFDGELIATGYQAMNKLTLSFDDFDFDYKDYSIGELLFLMTRFSTKAKYRNDNPNDNY